MSEDAVEETPSIHEMTEMGREKLAQAQTGAKDVLSAVANYARANPWVVIAGAAIIGGAVVALTRSSRSESRMDVVRDWLDEAYAKLPSQKQVQAVVETSGVSDFLTQFKKKLHLS